MDVLEIFLDDDDSDVAVTAKPAEQVPSRSQFPTEEVDLLLEEFRSAPDTASQKDALLAILALTRK